MKRSQVFIGVVAVCLVVVALLTSAILIYPAREITLVMDGDADQTLKATFIVDGTMREEMLTTPATRTFSGSKLLFWIHREADPAKPALRVDMSVDGLPFGSAVATSPDQCARGGICTASLFRLRREQSHIAPVSPEVVAARSMPPSFPVN